MSKPKWPDGAPGSPAANSKGCACPVMDNSHGKGRGADGRKYGWWINDACALHAGGKVKS